MPLLGTLGTASAKSFGFTAVSAVVPNAPTSITATNVLLPTPTLTTTYDIPYGSNFLQKVDLVVPSTILIKGVIVYIHGGGWTSGSKSASGYNNTQAAYTNNDEAQVDIVAQSGYIVVNCNYRLVGTSIDYGSDGTGGYPNSITDIQTILNYCMVSGAGAAQSSYWTTIYNYVQTYGLMVAGYSAGGHLAFMGAGNYGTSSGNWPRAVCSISGPMDLVFNGAENQFDSFQQALVNAFAVPSDPTGSTYNLTNLTASSPRYQYGTSSASTGPWYTALNSSSCKFYFIDNNNDTLTTLTSVLPFVNTLPVSRHSIEIVTEGSNSVPHNHNYTTSLSAHILDFASQAFTSWTPVTKVTVSYTQPSFDGGASILTYTAYAYLSGVKTSYFGTAPGPSSGSINILGLAQNTSYTFEVYATNDIGNSAYSSPSSPLTTYSTPGQPTSVTATYTNGNSYASIAFTAPSNTGGSGITIAGYVAVAFISGTQVAAYMTGTVSPIVVNGLIGGQTYTFKVYAINAIGYGTASTATSGVSVITAPYPPTTVVATYNSGTYGPTSARITFTAPTNTGGSAITSYTITAFTTNPDATTGLTQTGTPSGTTFNGLTKGVNYTFRVTATNTYGTSIYSTDSNTIIPLTVPGAPTIGTVTANTVDAGTTTSVNVAFTAPADNGGTTITSYTAYAFISGVQQNTLYGSVSQSGSGTVTVYGLTKGQAYTFEVYATNSVGNSSFSSASSSVTPYTVPAPPTGLTPTNTSTASSTNASVSVAFTPSSDTGGETVSSFTVTSSQGQYNSGASPPISVSGLTKGVSYTFTATATNAAGTSIASNASSSITPLTVPSVPLSVSAGAVNGNTINVYFTAPADTGGTPITSYTATSNASQTGYLNSNYTVTNATYSSGVITFTFNNSVTSNIPFPVSSTITIYGMTPTGYNGVYTIVTAAYNQVTVSAGSNPGSFGSSGTITNVPQTGSVTITVTGFTLGNTYTFTVTATNSVGTSGNSNTSNSVLAANPPPPPTINSVTTSSTYTSTGQVVVNFTAPSSNGGQPITSYTAVSSPDTNNPSGVTATLSSGLPALNGTSSITVTGLIKNYAYTFVMYSYSIVGRSTTSSNTSSSITPLTVPAPPTIGSIYATSNTAITVPFSESDNGGLPISSNGYSATIYNEPGGTVFGTVTSSTYPIYLTGLTQGNSYAVKMTATNFIGTSSLSTISNTATTWTVPGAPTSVSGTYSTVYVSTTTSVTVSFTAPTFTGGVDYTSTNIPITNYTAYAYISGVQQPSLNGSASSSPITISGLTKGQAYTFEVDATNSVGTGSFSTASSSVTPVTVPNAPTIGTATDTSVGTVSTGSVSVTFTAPTDTGNGAAISSYTVTSLPGGFTGTGSSSPVTVSGLSKSTSYTFVVTATNSSSLTSAQSSQSNSVYPYSVPAAPTIGTPTYSTVYVSTTTTVNVAYTAPSDNGGSTITSYTAYAFISGVKQNSLYGTISQSGSGSVAVSGLTKGQAYTFEVYATNGTVAPLGNSAFSSASSSVTPVTVPNAPTIGTPTTSSTYTATGQVSVYFTAPTDTGNGSAITSYTVTGSPGGSASGSSSPILVSSLTKGTAYTFTVTATNSSSLTSASSNSSSSITPLTVPSTPASINATALTGSTATVTVSVPTDTGGSSITSYTVLAYSSSTTGGPYTNTGLTWTGSTQSVSVTGLTQGTYYVFYGYATNAQGNSGTTASYSNEIQPANVPSAPTITGVTQYPSYTSDGRLNVAVSPGSNGGAPITSITVKDLTNTYSVVIPGASGGTGTVTGLTKGTSYTFYAYATNRIGNSSNSSNSTATTPVSVPAAPTLGSITYSAPAGSNATASIPVSDTDSGGLTITSYSATSSPGSLTGSISSSSGTISVAGLTKGTSYTFNVTATNSQGTSGATTSTSITPYGSPTAPQSATITTTLSPTHATIAWSAPSDNGGSAISYYNVFSSQTSPNNEITSSTSYTWSGLTPNTAYAWLVNAVNGQGYSSSYATPTPSAIITPYYSTGTSSTSINETTNPSTVITFNWFNIPTGGGTIYWSTVTVSGTVTASEFSDSTLTGSFSITAGSGTTTLTRTQVADHLTEGNRSWYINFYIAANSESVATSSTVTVADTSLTYGVITFSASSSTVNVPKSSITSYSSSGSFIVTMSSGTVGTVTLTYSGDDSVSLSPSSFTFTYVGQTQTVNYTASTPIGSSAASSYNTTITGSISTGSGSSNPTFSITQTRIAYAENITVTPTSGYTTTTFTYTVTGAPGTLYDYWNSYSGYGSVTTNNLLSGSQGDASAGSKTLSGNYWLAPGTYTVYTHWQTTGDGDPSQGFSAGYATRTSLSVVVTYPPLTVSASPSTSMTGQVGQPFTGSQSAATGTASVSATGGSGSGYTYAVTSGSLPGGVTLSSSGTFSGSPTTSGFYSVTVTATDSASTTGTVSISIATIAAPTLTITSYPPNATAGIGVTVSWSSTGTSAVGLVVNGVTQSNQSSSGSYGLTFGSAFNNQTLSGTLTPIAQNGNSVSGSAQTFSWTIYPVPTATIGVSTVSGGSTTATSATAYATGSASSSPSGALYFSWATTGAVSLVYYLNTNGGGFVNQGALTPLTGNGGATTPLSSTTFSDQIYIVATNGAGYNVQSQTVTGTWLGVAPVISSHSTPGTYYPGVTSSQSITGTWFSSASATQYASSFSAGSGNQNSSTITYTLTAPTTVGAFSYTITVTGPYGSLTAQQLVSGGAVARPPAPTASLSVSPTQGYTDASTTISWTTAAGGYGATLSTGTLYTNGAASSQTATSSSITAGPPIAANTYSLYFIVTDNYGTSGTSNTVQYLSFTIPTVSATWSSNSPDGGTTWNFTISWTATSGSGYSTSSNLAGWNNATSGTYTSQPNYGYLPAGSYPGITITATSVNVYTRSKTITATLVSGSSGSFA